MILFGHSRLIDSHRQRMQKTIDSTIHGIIFSWFLKDIIGQDRQQLGCQPLPNMHQQGFPAILRVNRQAPSAIITDNRFYTVINTRKKNDFNSRVTLWSNHNRANLLHTSQEVIFIQQPNDRYQTQ